MLFIMHKSKIILFVCAFALIGIHAFAVYLLPSISPWHFLSRNWGFHFLTFYPPLVAICAYLVVLAVAVPKLNLTAANGIETITRHIAKHINNKALFWGGLSAVFVVVFYLGQQKYALLGDGYLRPGEVAAGKYYRYSVGVSFFCIQLQKWVGQWDDTGVLAFRIFSIAWGVPYVLLACAWSNLVGKLPHEKVFCFALMTFIGAFQYFFGYIETYAPLPSFMLAFMLCGILALKQNRLPMWSTACFAAGAIMHVLSLFLTPALLFLWWCALARKYPIFRDRKVVAFALSVFALASSAFAISISDDLLPLFPSDQYPYALFTVSHVWEFFNSQILSAPMAFPLILLSFFLTRFYRETAFLFIGATGAVFSLFVINAIRGSIDWDIFALSGVPLMALSTYTLQQIKDGFVKKYACLFSCICAFLIIIPFVHVNNTDRSVNRVTQIFENDPGHYYYSHDFDLVLGMSFDSAGIDSLAEIHYEKSHEKNPLDRRTSFNMGIVLLRKNQYAESIPYFLSALELSPNYEKALDALLWLALHYPDLVTESVDKHLPKSSHNNLWIRLSLRGMKTGKIQTVHDLSPEVTQAIIRRAHFYISQKDTNRAASLLKNTLHGNIQIKTR